ncbi:DUF3153 domain-containing protein [Calothrix sp. UHCC 0171]|uniref:DUF3153 domain-containing protein n=1 Tax=Calothrix sp. UHCC 0171 TaxID=3110245 RepID=UPI002B201143|nr:DUF3153 domain-containing protein [Calothrix sp. UHCC 0171]MEA5571395.1 DUF3153 domain-containing protein [Calothrix sp. UHCC 0171]
MMKLIIRRTRVVWFVVLASLLLSGCVKYDVGVNFANANSGELVQHIRLGEKLTSFSGDSVYEWLNSIERRARKLSGKARRISKEELVVSIPFSNGQELQAKYNEFFNPNIKQKAKASESASDLPKIESNLLLFQNNFLLLVRNHLIYDLDLRSLALISNNGNVLANAGSILDLEFNLKAPWGAKNIPQTSQPIDENTAIENPSAITPERNGKQLIWHFQPGELNHIEVTFWLPSPLGIGTLIIILVVWGGIYLRYTFMPDPTIQDKKSAIAQS